MPIPTDFTEFLYWVRDTTEAYWSSRNCKYDWFYGATWQPLTDAEIDGIEQQYGVRFTPDHREFLKILHAIDKYEPIVGECSEIIEEIIPFFYNWKIDEQEIRRRLAWSKDTILEDILRSQAWLKSWGIRPESADESERIFTGWFAQAPKLIPIHGHRFVVSEPCGVGNPVLSVMGMDTIVYGWNLRYYLLNELYKHLGLTEIEEYLNEAKARFEYSIEANQELSDIQTQEWQENNHRIIPFWSELINYWN